MSDELVDLANGERVRAWDSWRGYDDLARAWGYTSAKRVEQIFTAERKVNKFCKERGLPHLDWIKHVPCERYQNGKLKAYAGHWWHAMEIYKNHILELKMRDPHTPTTGGTPGTRRWGQRSPFAFNLDERLYRELEQEAGEIDFGPKRRRVRSKSI